MIDILNIEENVISKDLKGRFICIYGAEKVGKSTFGANLPKPLFCDFEIGTNYLPVKPIVIDKWATFKLVLRQLENEKAHEMYNTVVIDTVSEAYASCEKFICQQNGVQSIGEIPWGAGYSAAKREFEDSLRKITLMGYGLCCICHAEKKNLPGPNDTVIETVQPAMPTRAADIVNRMVDIIAYIDQKFDEQGNSIRNFITRRTPNILAGSRLPYLDAVIPFSYNELIAAIGRAIDKQVENDHIGIVEHSNSKVEPDMTYTEIRAEAQKLWGEMIAKGISEEEKEEIARTILKKAEMIFGHPVKLGEITEDQSDIFYLLLLEMRDMNK